MIIFAVMDSLRKKEILLMWKQLLPFLILFIVHDTLSLPAEVLPVGGNYAASLRSLLLPGLVKN